MKDEIETTANEQILSNEDLSIIENIANKYSISVAELGRIIARKKVNYPRLQILLNEDELNLIDSRANGLNIPRSKYCSLCYKKALKEELYRNIDILKVIRESESGKKREFRAVISFDNSNDYISMKKFSEELGLPFSSLVRYFALTVQL